MGMLYLGWRYVAHHRWKTGFLVATISLIVFLPPALLVLIERGSMSLSARAEATPLLLGAVGSPLELTLNNLYFSESRPGALNTSAIDAVDFTLADAIPLYVRFRSRQYPIVGTGPDYFRFRELSMADGRPFALLGECVIGASLARTLGIGVGDAVISSPESLFDLAGVYPLKMRVVGVLAPSLTPDDDAVFTDLKTTWVIEGLGHGHQDLATAETPDVVLARDEQSVTANAALVQFNEITDDNRDSFHFHGSDNDYPLTGVIVVPKSEKARAILLGRFLDAGQAQLVRPDQVIGDLLVTVFAVQAFVLLIVGLVGVAALVTAALVLGLSIRLRARELLTLQRMGAARESIFAMMGAETLFVLTAGGLLALAMLASTRLIGTTELVLLFAG